MPVACGIASHAVALGSAVLDRVCAAPDFHTPHPDRELARLAYVLAQAMAAAHAAAVPWWGVVVGLGIGQRAEQLAYEYDEEHANLLCRGVSYYLNYIIYLY